MDKGKTENITLDNYKLGPKQIENTYGILYNFIFNKNSWRTHVLIHGIKFHI